MRFESFKPQPRKVFGQRGVSPETTPIAPQVPFGKKEQSPEVQVFKTAERSTTKKDALVEEIETNFADSDAYRSALQMISWHDNVHYDDKDLKKHIAILHDLLKESGFHTTVTEVTEAIDKLAHQI